MRFRLAKQSVLFTALWASLTVSTRAASARECVYVTSEGKNTLEIVDVQRGRVAGSIGISGYRPYDVAVLGEKAYVVARGPYPPEPSTVSVINLRTWTEAAVIPVGSYPTALVASPDGDTLYVANRADNSVSIIDTSQDVVVSTVDQTGIFPNNLAISADGSTVYVTSHGASSLVVLQDGQVADRIELGEGQLAAAYLAGEDGDLVLVAGNGRILAVDPRARAVRFTIPGAGIVTNMAVDPRVGRLYWGTAVARVLVVADLSTHEVIRLIDIDPRVFFEWDVQDVALSGDGRFAYATGPRHGVYVVNLATLAVTGFIAIPTPVRAVLRGLTVAECPPEPFPPTATPTPTPTPSPAPTQPPVCAGDCNDDLTVTIDEIVTLVGIALGDSPVSACVAGDLDGNGQATVDEILGAVSDALSGCTSTGDECATPAGVDVQLGNTVSLSSSVVENLQVTFGTGKRAYSVHDACVAVSLILTNTGSGPLSLSEEQARMLRQLPVAVYRGTLVFLTSLVHRTGPPIEPGVFLPPGTSTVLSAIIDSERIARTRCRHWAAGGSAKSWACKRSGGAVSSKS